MRKQNRKKSKKQDLTPIVACSIQFLKLNEGIMGKNGTKLNLYKFKTFLRVEIKVLFSSGKPMVMRR